MVDNSTFLDNQEGILTGPDTGETITIRNSKFEKVPSGVWLELKKA
jgi:hypothetical protein